MPIWGQSVILPAHAAAGNRKSAGSADFSPKLVCYIAFRTVLSARTLNATFWASGISRSKVTERTTESRGTYVSGIGNDEGP